MKVFVHFEGTPDFTQKLQIESDTSLTVQDVTKKFTDAYNDKHGTTKTLQLNCVELLSSSRKLLNLTDVLTKVVKDGDDIYINEKKNVAKTCTHNGCGKQYTEEENVDNSCCFHPGVPVFHEGLKGWGCCTKKVISFDDFLQIPGCSYGKHTDIDNKPKEAPKQTASDVKLVSTAEKTETYSSSSNTYANQPLKRPITGTPTPAPKVEEVEEDDPVDAVIAPNTACLHRGCNARYEGEQSRTEKCVYHPGVPIFHEGSKGWSCCNRKTLEFDEFLKIEGCKQGKHKFVPKKEDSNLIQCRYDWYQTGNSVIVSVYGKGSSKDQSKVDFEANKLKMHIKFNDGKEFIKEINLTNTIDPSQSKVNFLSTKIEFNLRKSDGSNWIQLE